MPCGQSFKDDIWLSFRNDICTLSLKWYMTVSSKEATALSIILKWYIYYRFEMTFRKKTVFCTPLACSECLPIESWPNSIGKHPAEKIVCYLFEMIYDFHFEMSDSDHNRFEMTNDYPFKMSNTVLCSFRYDIWLSFRNDRAKFSYRGLFSSGKTPCILVTKITPNPHIFVHRFFRSDCPLAAWK